MPMTNEQTITRWAAVVPVFVQAGCEFRYRFDEYEPHILDNLLCTVATTEEACIAVLEQWFAQTVVPWAWLQHDINIFWQSGGGMTNGIKSPCDPKWWIETWNGEVLAEGCLLTCAEALAKVVKGASDD